MIKVERSSNAPESLKERKRYDGEDVVQQLKKDFYDKCYICGIKPVQDPNIEHLLPHKNGKYIDRKYDWNNLFWSCSHCNGIKNQNEYDEHIIDCCQRDPEKLLDFKVENDNILVDAKDSSDLEAVSTAQLMYDVFNKKNTGMRVHKCQVRVDALLSEMNALYDNLEKYQSGDCSLIVKRTLKGLLDKKSPFAEFKRSYIRNHKEIFCELLEFIN